MAKGLRFKLKFTIPSFKLCCSKQRHSTVPSIHRLSPMNLPAPPPSTPEHHFKSHQISHLYQRFLILIHFQSMQPTYVFPSTTTRSTTNSPDIVHCESTFCKMGLKTRTKSNFLVHKLNNNIDPDYYESLLSCSTSFSDEFYHEMVNYSPRKSHKAETKVIGNSRQGKKMDKKKGKGVRVMSRASSSSMAKESFAVVKKSSDPYEDFRKSMVEMIMEMDIFEAQELERLLQCFLALNSQCYHGVIVRVFMDIWHQLFVL